MKYRVIGGGSLEANGTYIENGTNNDAIMYTLHGRGQAFDLFRDEDERGQQCWWIVRVDETDDVEFYVNPVSTAEPPKDGWIPCAGKNPPPIVELVESARAAAEEKTSPPPYNDNFDTQSTLSVCSSSHKRRARSRSRDPSLLAIPGLTYPLQTEYYDEGGADAIPEFPARVPAPGANRKRAILNQTKRSVRPAVLGLAGAYNGPSAPSRELPARPFRAGEDVEVLTGGEWKKGTVAHLSCLGGRINVRLADGKWETMLPPDHVRRPKEQRGSRMYRRRPSGFTSTRRARATGPRTCTNSGSSTTRG